MGLVMQLPTRPGGTARRYDSGDVAQDLTGATYRQIDYWIRKGFLGAGFTRGSGTRRHFTPAHLELIHALAVLAALGGTESALARATVAMRAGRVHHDGERLIVPLTGTAYRMPADKPVGIKEPAWLCPIRPFTEDDQRSAS